MREKKISIWAENIFSIYSAKYLVDKYKKKNYEIHFYTYENLIDVCKEFYKEDKIKFISIESIDKVWLRVLHYLYVLFFISPKFSVMYQRVRFSSNKLFVLISRYLNFPVRKNIQNKIYYSFFSNINKTHFESLKIYSFTLNQKPYLLANKNIEHISILESWDHPIKQPWLISPKLVLAWNKDLKKDIYENQFLKNIKILKPLKFQYIYEYEKLDINDLYKKIMDKKYIDELNLLKGKQYVLYPTTTSSANPFAHDGEMALIDELCKATNKLGIYLYIKPKPNGNIGDYNVFKRHDHVIIGIYSTDTNAKDLLDEDYNIYRYLLLKHSYLVMNVGTTLVLEASLVGTKIMQLNLKQNSFDNFSVYSKNSHIEKYLNISGYYVTFEKNHLLEIGKIELSTSEKYSTLLKNWILNG